MDGERTVERLAGGKPGRKGRTRLSWMDDVVLNLRNMGVKRWRMRAADRTEWGSVVRGKQRAKLEGL
jgi:hypothetical protein